MLVIMLRCDSCYQTIATGPATITAVEHLLAIGSEHACPSAVPAGIFTGGGEDFDATGSRPQISKEEIAELMTKVPDPASK